MTSLGAVLHGGRLCMSSRLADRRSAAYTHTCCNKQRQCQACCFSQSHWLLQRKGDKFVSLSYCFGFSAGTTPERNIVKTRSLSCRRMTLNTTFSPGFNFDTAAR